MLTRRVATRAGADAVQRASESLMARYDRQYGGFSAAPKFPNESSLLLLARQASKNGDPAILQALRHTLNAMARGGIYDQVGGGFHRYSTDAQWLVPHFEKMLYNQSQLAQVYTRGFQLFRDAAVRRVAEQTLDYVLAEMQAPTGAFYSATDADSEGEEGIFFVWTEGQIDAALPAHLATRAKSLYGLSAGGNFEGSNILHLPRSVADYAAKLGLEHDQLLIEIELIRKGLQQHRNKRLAPLLDDKILTAWNGMMIQALAEAAMILEQPRYLAAAITAAKYIQQQMWQAPDRLLRVSLAGHASIDAGLQDYAALGAGLLALYDATADPVWLQWSQQLADAMLILFADPNGGFFMNRSSSDELLFLRPKQGYDGALPSGNSLAVQLLGGLWLRSGESRYLDAAHATLAAFGEPLQRSPSGFSQMAMAADELINGQLSMVQYAARGAVRVTLKQDGDDSSVLQLALSIAPDWHLNSNQVNQTDLAPTLLTLEPNAANLQLTEVRYPEPVMKQLDLRDDALSLFVGDTLITARLLLESSADTPPSALLALQLQACNNTICLAPETLRFPLRSF